VIVTAENIVAENIVPVGVIALDITPAPLVD